ncbi:MAG TPA: hypothetical protein VE825_17090 [Terriglobales bacterium]|jgi:hypothetical protein|nr:hypothetical protein [Terriglobales bacterium]
MFNQFRITANNRLQSLGEMRLTRANAIGNLAVEKPSVQQMNAAIARGGETSYTCTETEEGTPAFGTHIGEAARAVRRLLK